MSASDITSVVAAGAPEALGAVAILVLVTLLVVQDVVSASTSGWPRALSHGLPIVIVPLCIAVIIIVAPRLELILR